jgi:hypothetical protein
MTRSGFLPSVASATSTSRNWQSVRLEPLRRSDTAGHCPGCPRVRAQRFGYRARRVADFWRRAAPPYPLAFNGVWARGAVAGIGTSP